MYFRNNILFWLLDNQNLFLRQCTVVSDYTFLMDYLMSQFVLIIYHFIAVLYIHISETSLNFKYQNTIKQVVNEKSLSYFRASETAGILTE